jgi:TPR repeat protein
MASCSLAWCAALFVLLGACHPVATPIAPTPIAPAPIASPVEPLAAARTACASAAPTGCDDLAEHWSQRELGPAAPADAALLRAGCDDHQQAAACFGYALMRKYGTADGTRDKDAAAPYFARLTELGDLNGFRGPPSPAGQAALAATTAACAGGRPRACAQLGWAAFGAIQQDKDVRVAARAWQRACELGVASACRWAGHVAYSYDEVRDLGAARRLLERAAAAANPGGEDELGLFLDAIDHDPGAARDHYLRGCALGSRTACLHAGVALLRDACAAGEETACTATPPPPPAH